MTKITKRMGKLREFSLREVSRDELVRLQTERRAPAPTIQFLRDSHHAVARLFASGLRLSEIAAKTGYSYTRVQILSKDPAFQQLVAEKRKIVDEAWVEQQDEYQEALFRNMMAAERHIADAIDEADQEGKLLPIKTAIAISRDAADRLGYGKKQTNLNVNVDFAKNLEAMLRRSGKGGAATPQPLQPPAPPTLTASVQEPPASAPEAPEARRTVAVPEPRVAIRRRA